MILQCSRQRAETPSLDALPPPSVHASLSRVGFWTGPVSSRRPVRKESPPRPRLPRNPGKCPVNPPLIFWGFWGISPPDRLRSPARSSSGIRLLQNMCSTFCAPLALSRRRVPAHGVLEHGHPPPYKSPPLRPFCLCTVPGSPGCAGGGRMPVGDSNALATRRQLPGRWDRGDRRRSAHS